MKVLQKTIFGCLSVVLVTATLVSCNDFKSAFGSGINFTKPEDMKTLNEMLGKAIKPDMIVQEIRFVYSNGNEGFSDCKDKAVITYVDADDNKVVHAIDVDLKTGDFSLNKWLEDHPRNTRTSRVEKGVKLEKFDFSKIADMVNAAGEMMKAEGIEPNGIGSFSIDFGAGDISETTYRFKMQHRTGLQQNGRRIEYQYNEYDFKADIDGNLSEN